MANELAITATMRLKIDNLDRTYGSRRFLADVADADMAAGVVSTSTTSAIFDMSLVSSPGYAYFRNLDATASIQIGIFTSAAFEPFCNLGPGDIAILKLHTDVKTTTPLRHLASEGTPQLDYVILEA